MLAISTLFVVNIIGTLVAGELTAVVQTTYGPIQGEILETAPNSVPYAAFKGIRYAKAPTEYRRFQPPVVVDKWTEILNATVEGDNCTQSDNTGAVSGSEDCLFINVFTPVTNLYGTPVNLKSVMVWIYGGAFRTGTSSSLTYNPDYIIEKDVVYVAMNYRLGALGFLNLNHPNATGNAGLKDQVLALKWVQSNIAKFGGNPKNVTIFGQSAGSASVGYQVLSDASTGLFHGAILMSGVPLNPWAFQTSEKALSKAFKLGFYLGTITTDKATLLNALYRASAAEIIIATSQVSKVIPPFVPTLEDKTIATDVFLSTCSVTKYTTGNYNKVPQMLGFMDQETMAFYGVVEPFFEIVAYAISIAKKIGLALPPGLRAIKSLIDLGVNIADKITAATLNEVIKETTDILFIAQIDQTQKFLANNVKPIYYYHVSFHTNRSIHNILGNNTLQGAAHADDLAYIFYFPAANYSNDLTDPVARTIHRYSTMWTNFAKYGNPTPNWINDTDLNVIWPDSGTSGTSLNIGNELKVEPRPVSTEASLIELLSRPLLGIINGCNRIALSDLFRGSSTKLKNIPAKISPKKISVSKNIPLTKISRKKYARQKYSLD